MYSGDLVGEADCFFVPLKVTADGTIFIDAPIHTVYTADGSFALSGTGVLSPAATPGVYRVMWKGQILPGGTLQVLPPGTRHLIVDENGKEKQWPPRNLANSR